MAPLPNVDFPAIVVSASSPGASPETMASSVATPLERPLGRIAGISEMTSCSSLGSYHRAFLCLTWRRTSTAPPATFRRRSTAR
ncbi:efflux RND transporter permease subunit [Pseudomonas aeruginosa]